MSLSRISLRARAVAQPLLRPMSSSVAVAEPLIKVSEDSTTGIATLTLHEPKRLNALTVTMGDEFAAAVKDLKANAANVSSVVITGAGRAFSAGGDVQFLRDRCKDTPSRNAVIMRDFYDRMLSIRSLPMPTICALNGHAIGAGLAFTLAADFRIAAENAQLGVTFTKLGIHPGMGSSHFLPRLIGREQAARMLLTGTTVSGAEAARMGLVLKALPAEEVLPAALKLAGELGSASPIAVRTATRTLRAQVAEGLDAALWREADAQAQCYASADMVEGINAIVEKRAPHFKQLEGYTE